ncbi:MAG TPA: hypothetical protein DHW82_06695 [Spirochaetia bacterium]|nr:MAG: hypothetical protein A2Y41_11120 [Spirochaetes bacterium GWB1_36_13]HCL56682.1 hypothetical protein [Spirochaetia bacterium]
MAENQLTQQFNEKLKKDFEEFNQYLEKVSSAYFDEDISKEIGSYPKKTIFENELMEIYCYEGKKEIPLLIITPHINAYYVLDLLPEVSFIKYLSENDFAPYLVRWKEPKEYEMKWNIEYYIQNGVKKAIDEVYEKENKKLVLLGHCLGGVLTSSYLSSFKDERISKYVSLNSPYDFSKMGEVTRMTSKEFLDVDKLVDSLGNIPSDFMTFGFQFINPAIRFHGLMAIFHNYFNKQFVRLYKALIYWREENIDMPGEFARDLIKNYFQENLLFRGNLKIGGVKADLKTIEIPVLNIISMLDDVAPYPSCDALKEKVKDIKTIVLPDGHLAVILLIMMNIPLEPYWKEILSWIKE